MKEFAWGRWAAVFSWSALLFGAASGEGVRKFAVPPRDTDSSISRFVSDNLVMTRDGANRGLLLFLPGTAMRQLPEGGKPFPFMRAYLQNAVDLGYHVIALQYDNSPAVMQVCLKSPDDSCTANVREKRIFGVNSSNLIDDTPAESIASRLTHLLSFLAEKQPRQGWDRYLVNGSLRWDLITVSGHSQGAGMAAYIAKKHAVERVVLLSGPIDYLADGHTIAPWVSSDSATPPGQWFGAYHAQEKGANLLSASFEALHIPSSHIRVLNGAPTPLPGRTLADPFHVSVVVDKITPRDEAGRPLYTQDWRYLLAGGN